MPRLTGACFALSMMLDGRPVSATVARERGVVDVLCDGDALAQAIDLARSGVAVRPTGRLPVPEDLSDALAQATGRAATQAERHIVDCVAAMAQGDLRHGLGLESALFAQLMVSPDSLALRHAFFGRRIAARVPGLAAEKPLPVRHVGVVGAGLMGTGIALAVLNAGLSVTVVDTGAQALAKAHASLESSLRRDCDKGRIDQATLHARLARLTMADTMNALADVDLVIEAVFEDMAVKCQVFGEIAKVARDDAILASNTSTLDVDVIAAASGVPERVVGLHFFSPANIMRLLEVVRGRLTSPRTLASAMAFGKAIGKTAVAAGVCDGFIGNRMFEEYLRQAWFLLEEGALPAQLDGALKRWGMAMGPCAVMDLAGQDIGWSIRKRRAIEQPDRPYSRVPDLLCEAGRFGQKTGAGFYLYPDGRNAVHDRAVDAMIEAEAARIGLPHRQITDEEIVERCILALVNEGARVLGEGIAYRPVDIDVVYLDGYGFPASRVGPCIMPKALACPPFWPGSGLWPKPAMAGPGNRRRC
jgi:3-hydroxyacyl-CoA dehydrogenase